MTRRIVADIRRLSGLAATLHGIGQQAEALKANLATAVRPAQGGDVPEAAEIAAGHMSARAALAQLSGDIAGQVAAIRSYAQALVRVETILALYRYRMYLQAFGSTGTNPFGFAATSGIGPGGGRRDPGAEQLRKDLVNLGLAAGMELAPGLPTTAEGALDLTKGVGFLGAKSIALKTAFAPWSMVMGWKTATDETKARGERLGAAMDVTVGMVGGYGSLLKVAGTGLGSGMLTKGGSALTGAAGRAFWPVAVYQGSYALSSHYQRGFEADAAAGRSSLDRINQQVAGRMSSPIASVPGARNVIAVEAGYHYVNLGVHEASKAIAKKIWPDTPPPDELDAHTTATLLGHVKEFHPDARVVPLDGEFLVKVPDGTGKVDVVRVDNDELRIK
jgi:hypothetical protein